MGGVLLFLTISRKYVPQVQQARFAPKALKARAEMEKAEALAAAAAVRAKVWINDLVLMNV